MPKSVARGLSRLRVLLLATSPWTSGLLMPRSAAQSLSFSSRPRRPSAEADSSVINAHLAVNRAKIALAWFELNKLRRNVDRQFPEVIAGSRLPRARPSQTGSQVKPSFTRKSFPDLPPCLQ